MIQVTTSTIADNQVEGNLLRQKEFKELQMEKAALKTEIRSLHDWIRGERKGLSRRQIMH